jgi:Glycogen recognition site of AMP-activated protein kinase
VNTLVPTVLRFPGTLAPGARHVAVVGSFNAWNPMGHPLVRTANGNWTITIYLPPGRTAYHFSVDGAPWLDPQDEARIPNGWGSEYSVRCMRRRTRGRRAQLSPGFEAKAMRMMPTSA